MSKAPWFERSPDLVDEIRKALSTRYRTLHLYIDGGEAEIRGSIPVVHADRELDRYQVRIVFPSDYPKSVPIVFEIGGRIPHLPDYHVIPAGNRETSKVGSCCLFVDEDRWAAWPAGSAFENFLEDPVRNFFLSQTHFRETGRWPEGWEPRGHGEQGIFEAYRDHLGAVDDATVLRYMWTISHREIKGHWPCPCGSGNKIKQCSHRDEIRNLQTKIPSELVRDRFEADTKLRERAAKAMFGETVE